MTTLNIGGKRVKVDDAFMSLSPEQQQQTVDEIAGQIGAAPTVPEPTGLVGSVGAPGRLSGEVGAEPTYDTGRFGALTEGSQAGVFGGFDDEIAAGMMAPFDAAASALRGDGFDIGGAYAQRQKAGDERKAARRGAYPGTSIAGEVMGGLAMPGMVRGTPGSAVPAASRMPTFFGKVPGAVAAPLEGASYGALYGAGEAKPGERLQGAAEGGATGAAFGTALHTAGSAVSKAFGGKSAPIPAPTADDLAAQAKTLYAQADQAGIVIQPKSFDRVIQNAKAAAGGINDKLRPNTAGIIDDLSTFQGKPVTLEALDEFRQVLNQSMERAQPQDVRTLMRVKTVIDNFADTAKPGDITGDVGGFDLIKQARNLWARQAKTRTIDKLLDLADVKSTGKYTQSGLANAIRQEAMTLYKDIVKNGPKGFSKEEVALIRNMASGGSNSQIINWLAKFAPRGVVSTSLGALTGSSFGGPLGMAAGVGIPVAGSLAARSADKGALRAMTTLRDSAARGYMAKPPMLSNRIDPFIPGTGAPNTEIRRRLP